jgi:pimeloyl-ACP methyl ester carboxylesterase
MKIKLSSFYVFVLAYGIAFTSCSKDDKAPADGPKKPDPKEQVILTAREVLEKSDRVTIIKDTLDKNGGNVTYFYFKQPLDHKNPEAGSFNQYCVFHYRHPDSVTILHTQGYSIPERRYFSQPDLSKNFGGNYLEVEHRYYKRSEIGNSSQDYKNPSYWNYNTAAQSTADLHDIVTAMKATKAFNGKWISTGISKNGILTTLYAYYYPNEVDVYVPFCAPFCTEAESSGIGQYVTQQCAKGTDAQKKAWEALKNYLNDKDLQEKVAELYKAEFADNEKVQKYSTKSITRLMAYRFMKSMFQKFAYHPVDEWADVIPESNSSAQIYYLFASLGSANFNKRLKALRELYEIEKEDEYYDYEDDTYDDYEDNEEDGDYWDEEEDPAEEQLVPSKILSLIYSIHASKELGYFLYDWQWLLNDGYITDNDVKAFNRWQTITKYNTNYETTYDGGKLMKDVLTFVQNNRNDKKCRMLFVYGADDPWTGAAIPDPAADGQYVIKYTVPKGVHNWRLDDPHYYGASDKETIITTVRQLLKK